MATTAPPSDDKQSKQDERLRRESPLKKLLRRPELAAVGGTALVWLFFALAGGKTGFLSLRGVANYLQVAAELGILAVAVSVLMIGGEFDLSVGSVIGSAGMITAVLTVQYGWNIWLALLMSLAVSLMIGALNGLIVVITKLPSFIVTLGSLFIVRGATLGLTRLATGRTQVGGLPDVPGYEGVARIFASVFSVVDPSSTRGVTADFPISIVWWLGIAAVATYILLRTRPGNWIFGIGGDKTAARNMGVPVDRIKILLYMATAAAAWLVATIQVVTVGSADTLRGQDREFYAIIVVVIGGTLLTGGYGSAIGSVFGAIIFGMVQQGIVFTGIDSDWFKLFLGSVLISAVLVNNFIRQRIAEAK
jgi:simple sugar transport system permease protein